MIEQDCFKRLTLRAVLRHVSPMVIRLISVSDRMDLADFNDMFCAVLGWSGNMGYILRIHGQEYNSFRRKTRAKSLQEFRLHRQEKFLYVCDALNRWEWDVQVLDASDLKKQARVTVEALARTTHDQSDKGMLAIMNRYVYQYASALQLQLDLELGMWSI